MDNSRSEARKGSLRITNGALPTGKKAWGFSAESGAAFTSCELNNSGNDDKAARGWDSVFDSNALQACEYGEFISAAVITGTITFYLD